MKLYVVFMIGVLGRANGQYEPNWDSLDTRPLPAWYDQSKFGIFLHWGVYSVPSTYSEWFWYDWHFHLPTPTHFMQNNYPPDFTYQDFARQFQIEFFDPDQWADLFSASGARYVVLTSKHHEGFTLWPSKVSYSWNAIDVGPKKDLVGALATSIRTRTDLHFGLYHSLYEWFHPLYLQDRKERFINQTFPLVRIHSMNTDPAAGFMGQRSYLSELYEIVTEYEPEVVWSDGDWEAPYKYWGSEDFLAWLYNDSPVKDTVVTNDRWGNGTSCAHGGFYTCSDRYNPGVLQDHKWENCMTIDRISWGYRRDASLKAYLTIEELIFSLATTISCGGNLLLNVGPTAYGTINPIFEERLRQMGQWLGVNGEAVYSSSPWTYQNDTITPNIWYTTNLGSGNVYAFILDFPPNYVLTLGAPTTNEQTKITLLGTETEVQWAAIGSQGLELTMPCLQPNVLQWAWVLKMQDVH